RVEPTPGGGRPSIEKLPSHAVDVRLARHEIVRHLQVLLAKKIPKLPGNGRAENANLDERRVDAVARCRDDTSGTARKTYTRAVLVHDRRLESKVAGWESSDQVRLKRQLAPRLIPRPVEPRRVVPAHGR